MMFTSPELYDTRDYICPVDSAELRLCLDECVEKPVIPCDETVFELCCIIMEENNWEFPCCADEAVNLYKNLRQQLYSEL